MSNYQAHFPQSENSETVTERTHLRISSRSIRELLRASTDNINNLRARDQAHVVEDAARERELKRAQDERDMALVKARDDLSEYHRKTRALKGLLGLGVVCVVVYCFWCWCTGPEMSYIRQRRLAVLLE